MKKLLLYVLILVLLAMTVLPACQSKPTPTPPPPTPAATARPTTAPTPAPTATARPATPAPTAAPASSTPGTPSGASTPGTASTPIASSKPPSATSATTPQWQYERTIKEPLKATTGAQSATLGNLATNQVQVVIPSGAFPSGTAVTVTTPDTVPAVDAAVMTPVGVPVSISAGDKPTRLKQLMTVTLKFDPGKLPKGTNASLLWATFWDGQTWQLIKPDKVDLQAGTLTFSSGHVTLFGTVKITVDERIEQFVHSKTVADIAQKDVVDEAVNKIAEAAIDHILKDRLGMSEESTKYKISSSLLKDDEWGDIIKQAKTVYSNGLKARQEDDIVGLVQTINGFVGKKLVENLDEGTLSKALKTIPGAGDDASKGLSSGVGWVTAGTDAAAYLAEKNYREAARIIGSKLADDIKLVKAVKASAEIIDYRINIWKDGELEAAYKAYRNGSSTRTGYGYEVDKGDFNGVWDQARAIGERMQFDAVEAEKRGRIEGGQSPPSAREEQLIRDKVKTNLEAEFKARSAKDDQVASQEAELKKLMAVFKSRGLLDDASGFRYPNDNLDSRLDAVMRMRDKILRDAKGQKVTNEDIADLTASYLSGSLPQGRAAYIALLKKKFGIDLNAPITVAASGRGLIQSRDKSQSFGTEANPFPVTLSGTIIGDPGLKFEGVTYSHYAGLMNAKVTTFAYSIPADASKTTLDFENVVVKVGNPATVVVKRSTPRTASDPAMDSTDTWTGWGEGKWSVGPIKNIARDTLPPQWWTTGPSWTNGAPVSGKDVVMVDAGPGVPWAQAGGVQFNLTWSGDLGTVFGPPIGKEKQLAPYKSSGKGVEIVVIRLEKRL